MQCAVPSRSLLARYAFSDSGTPSLHYTDCFSTAIAAAVDLNTYVRAFYTTPLFRSERLVLGLSGLASTDSQLDAMLAGSCDRFAAWSVEERTPSELLMCDVNRRTRSWFRVESGGSARTTLWFGSAVTANPGSRLPLVYRGLLPVHRLYSRALLSAASRRLSKAS